MRLSLDQFNDPGRDQRHILRLQGPNEAIEALLNHISHGDGLGLEPDEIEDALWYIDGGLVVLAHPPDHYVAAQFGLVDYAITRSGQHATVVFDMMSQDPDLIRLLMAFHPEVGAHAIILDENNPRIAITAEFGSGEWRTIKRRRIPAEHLAGLSDPEWQPATESAVFGPFRDIGYLKAGRDVAQIAVRGNIDDVERFESELRTPTYITVGCHLDHCGPDDDLVVSLRRPSGLHTYAETWSVQFPDLEFEAIYTRLSGTRTRVVFRDGEPVVASTIDIDEWEVHQAFGDARVYLPQKVMTAKALRDVLGRHLRGSYTVPAFVSPTNGDVAWFKREGRAFRNPRPHPTFVGEPRSCWRNATKALWHDRSLRYAQGFVQGSGSELIPHAWCIGPNDELVEVTWDVSLATGAETYFGVVFTLDQLVHLQVHFETYDWYDGFAEVLKSVEA
jgi:hypothetical protein